ncbi:MAG TPA: hypothetical protein VFG18_09525 [Xanthomonadaceae bacterium]|jgi:hypothetical protein|nr:hypothetical protein [Xanthomonadaceae bacterium]
MARTPTKPVASNSLSHESIADDIAAFRKRGGRIEVLGNTPLRTSAPTAFRSSTSERKPPAKEQRKRVG